MENRRNFMKSMSLGAFGLTIGSHDITKYAMASEASSAKSRVSFVVGSNRRDMIYQVLKPFEKVIKKGIRGKQIIIKPNNVQNGQPLCATHPDAIRGLLDFLIPFYDETIIIGESTASEKGTMFTFNEYGYSPLEKEYNAKLVDLNLDSYSIHWIRDDKAHPLDVKIIDTFLNPNNYIISLARMKTHNVVIGTLAFKNIIMASPINLYKNRPEYVENRIEKRKVHQGGSVGINWNMFQIALKIRPQFSIIDGFIGMEGNGPVGGTQVEHGVALAGPDVVSVDRIGLELMGIDYNDVGYLQWCSAAGIGQGDRSKIEIIGPDIKDHIIPYKLHENIESQLKWKENS